MVWHRLEAERHPRHSNAETQGAIISTIVRRSASHAVLDALRPILSVRRRYVTWNVTLRFSYVSWMCLWLKAPFRPSAPYFEGPK
ncbi:hypothetical protein CUB86_05990 [Pseudomonas syringae pv. actinidiae]|uniref:Uncharacterized protein n=1 Tax=Pseudomonas syringae pv. actinidiae TaxID=103796 RepID=A0AAU8XGI6_PSESF|nr:hypothetical protein CT122_13315 [Pseudomonas syringae pv. actinidiae]PIN62447.1 hypothetical protein CUB86_05990 [Pseudomonas syringae pv. actinidiae]